MTKRIFDIVFALLLLAPASILMLMVAAFTMLRDGRPVLYTEERIGRFDRPFKFFKFRSMSNARDAQGELLPDAERLTRWGRFLRASSMDELPQLWNVLRGDMSIVGPRPLPVRYLPRYTERQRRRHLVSPGITGWAQVRGRNALTWDQKFDFDIWYVEHQSFWLDLKILWLTGIKVIRRDGISQDGHATMPEFRGK
jgi:sugar transferase EpsL